MAARRVVEVVQCRVADLKIGDVVRPPRHVRWEAVQKVTEGTAGNLLLYTDVSTCPLVPYDLVDLQLTKAVYSNAPHMVNVELPDPSAARDLRVPVDDEGREMVVTAHRSDIDGAWVVDIDTPFEPYGDDYDPSGEVPCDNIRINLNDGKIWDNGLWDGRNDQLVPDPR